MRFMEGATIDKRIGRYYVGLASEAGRRALVDGVG